MGRIAFVFSGQGDQYPGMGRELAGQYECAARVFALCDRIRPGTSRQCFEGTEEELKETKNTQPCLFAMELAAAAALREAGIVPDAMAGFSLGEVTACTAAGMLDPETGFSLVCKRGERMQQAAEKQATAMAAVIKLSREQVEALCRNFADLYPVNYNCPGQIAVAGASASMPEFAAQVRAAGGRAVPLKVRGAFHSPFMKEAAEAFAADLAEVTFRQGQTTVYSDVTAQPYTEEAAELLAKQICSPVQWETLIRNLIGEGIDIFIEIGPGKTLCGLIRKIDGGVRTYSVSELPTLLAEVKA